MSGRGRYASNRHRINRMPHGVAGVDGAGGAGQVKLRAAAFQQRIQQQDEEARRMEDVKRWEERD